MSVIWFSFISFISYRYFSMSISLKLTLCNRKCGIQEYLDRRSNTMWFIRLVGKIFAGNICKFKNQQLN